MKNGCPSAERKKYFYRLFISCVAFFISIVSSAMTGNLPAKDSLLSGQLIIVLTDSWKSVQARLYCLEKRMGKWRVQFSFPAVVGQQGMAIGNTNFPIDISGAPEKKEGDMKSPAGFFNLGPAFGYAGQSLADWIHLRYVRATDTLICVDDADSRFYNELVGTDTVKADWHSHEEMHRSDDDYKWGIFVQQNVNPVKKANGSCIFLHIWESEGEGTAGCTAMEEKNMVRILRWIRTKKHPMLVQFPRDVYKNMRATFTLPDL